MHMDQRHRYALNGCGLLAFVALIALLGGCGQPVREDRSINWSREGESVGFQHGQEGVFLADKNGRKLTKIFQPDAEVIATSTPLWSPSGKRGVFTTARSTSGQPPMALSFLSGEQDPAGKIHLQQDIVYTCWLYEQSDGDKPSDPVALFDSTADHTGYVAANLAVRWHPRLERIEYVKQVSAHQHGLFEFDLASKKSRQIFPHTSEAYLFDWTPDGARLVCVLGTTHKSDKDGIWIGDPTQADWWHVPHSGELAPGEFGSLLENLRATRPAWTSNGSRFVFPSYVPGPTPQQPGHHFLRHATLATRDINVWTEGDQPFRDALWDKAGVRLGVVRGREDGALHLIRRGEQLSPAINRPVSRFAGWSANGGHLAYIAPDSVSSAGNEPWALLLIRDASARDKVFVAAGDGKEPGRPVFSGMRVTFPQWSPHDDKLSLWVTFMPAYRSVLSHLLGWGLRPGDPAAVFDLKSGQLSWMPVNAQEKVQVGHYYLLKRDYAQAQRWYQEAERELPAPAPVRVGDFMTYLRALEGPRDFSLFHYYCLTKLGRPAEARAKLEQFRQLFLPRLVESKDGQPPPFTVTVNDTTLERHLHDLLDPSNFVGRLSQDLYAAEVFLSVDAAKDAEAFFQAAQGQVDTNAGRLSRALVLGQIFLLEKKYREYADLSTETIGPLLTEIVNPVPAGGRSELLDPTAVTEFIGGLALLPLGAPEFLSQLPEKQRRDMLTRWEKLRAKANGGSRTLVDFVLCGLYKSLGREKEWQEASARLKSGTAGSALLPMDGEIGKVIVTVHTGMQALLQRRWR